VMDMRRKRLWGRILPAALALSLAAIPAAYADEFVPGPGQRYDDATLARLRDNVLEYDEIEMLIEEYNTTYKNLKESYVDTRDSGKDVTKMKSQILSGSGALSEQASELAGMAGMFKDALGYQSMVTPASYAELVYSSELLAQRAEQMTLSADTLTELSPEMLKIRMLDTAYAGLVSGAQSAMIGYQQLLLQKDSLADTLTLLEAVYQSSQTQAQAGLATQNDVLTARQNLEAAQAGMLTINVNQEKIRQTLCTMLGWQYNAVPEIRSVPAADLSRIERMNPEADKVTAIENNFTLRYNLLDYEKKTDGSIEQQNLERTLDQQREQIASSLVNLYNDVLQKRNEYQTAIAAYELEKTKMDAAERKLQVGTIGRLEYLQQKNAYVTKEIAVRNAELSLFQSMETYDWALKGNLSIS
jgi:hypothetical protein